jgi:glycosyltransferase involved in cell wall biosynthesis
MPQLAPLIVDVEKLADELGIAKHVRAIGFVAQEDLPSLYAGSIMFIFPTLYEGFGMPVLEAMSVGTPVITADDTSVPEVGGDAVKYAAHDDVSLSEAMEELLSHEDLSARLRTQGHVRAREFTWDKFFDHVREVGKL